MLEEASADEFHFLFCFFLMKIIIKLGAGVLETLKLTFIGSPSHKLNVFIILFDLFSYNLFIEFVHLISSEKTFTASTELKFTKSSSELSSLQFPISKFTMTYWIKFTKVFYEKKCF